MKSILKVLAFGVAVIAIGSVLNACTSNDEDDADATPTIAAAATSFIPTPAAPTTAPADPGAVATTVPAVPTAPLGEPATLLESNWTGTAEEGSASGGMRIMTSVDGGYTLEFIDVSIPSGPALRVYLTPDADGRSVKGALDLGPLQATSGSFGYLIPAGTDLALYSSAIVWCEEFSVLFAVAPLTPSEAG